MNILVSNEQRDLPLSVASAKKAIKGFFFYRKILVDEVSIHFVSSKKISTLHAEFFDDPSTTDCISFPIDQEQQHGYFLLGEIFICPKTAIDYVKKMEGNVYEELTLYLVHGLLHLLGFDDLEPLAKRRMRYQEHKMMIYLKKENLLITPRKKMLSKSIL